MSIINNPPETYKDCLLYQVLVDRKKTNHEIIEKIEYFIEHVTPLLNLVIAGPFRNYTLHNPDHSKKLLHLGGQIISESTLSELTDLDIMLFIYSCYFHDLGMSITTKERANLIKSQDYLDFQNENESFKNRVDKLRHLHSKAKDELKSSLEITLFQLQEFALSEILRWNHAKPETYSKLINYLKTKTGRKDLFTYNGVSFEEILIQICESHNLNSIVLGELESARDPRFERKLPVGGLYLNVQFVSAMLRISDILDFDRERTPTILFESLGIEENNLPGSKISLEEWNKHLSVHSIELSTNEIIINAESKHPSIEKATNEFAEIIEDEIKDTLASINYNDQEIKGKYSFKLPTNVRTKINSIEYVYHDLKLYLNQESIMTMLMGEQLYNNPGAALRELLQNSIDACNVRSKIAKEDYVPNISIELKVGEDESKWLIIKDNGIGMDEHVISKYLFQVGSSYYRSNEFSKIIDSKYNPISRFGIGVISVFMISDFLKITTKNNSSIRGDYKERNITISNKGSLAFITESEKGLQGTTMELRLKEEYSNKSYLSYFENYLRSTIIRPTIPIRVSIMDHFVLKKRYISFKKNAIKEAEEQGIKYIVLDLDRFSDLIEGYAILPLYIDGDMLVLNKDNRRIQFNEERSINPHDVFKEYQGNRVTVNGFKIGLKRTSRIFGKRLRFAYDINVIGNEEVRYDVARDRIIGKGVTIVKNRVREAIIKALEETGIIDSLEDTTLNYLRSSKLLQDDETIIAEKKDLEKIKNLIPQETWPIGLHQSIAKELDLRPRIVRNTISYFLDNDMVFDGRRK
ncbi:HD domain-containing protein [Aquimarina megaterium]|uniref:HD domain-containing protein n=1 Tax=Aquimarina megaterium TaxID=1443666 RepID=UPI00094253D3|nr:ATP-binding protein [Aquimarina megaterium]